MTYLPELRDSLVRAAAREYAQAAGAHSGGDVRARWRPHPLWGRGARLLPLALALSLTAAVAFVALTELRPARHPATPTTRSQQSLIGILGVLRGPETAADRRLKNTGFFQWNPAYLNAKPRVRYATTAPWGDRLFVFAPPIDATTRSGARQGVVHGAGSEQSLTGELVGLPSRDSSPLPSPYIPLTVSEVEAGRATFIWPGGQPDRPAAGQWIEPLFGPREEIAVVVPDGVAKVEFVLPRQPMAIVGAPVYPRARHVTARVHNNVAVVELDRKCCYLPGARLKQLALHGSETAQASGPMIWYGPNGRVIKRIGDPNAANRVITLPRPGPETAASRAAERDPSTPNPVSITPAVGHPWTRFIVHFRALLTGAFYGYELVGTTEHRCRIRGYVASPTTHVHIDGISAGYQPNVVRGDTWSGRLSVGEPLCSGTYRLSVSVVNSGVFGRSGSYIAGSKPFGSTTFTVR